MSSVLAEDPTISIVVPVKNSARTIRDLMDSLMKLEYDSGKLEIIVVDGNSTDNTKEIVKGYPVKLVDEEGKGLNAARNTGIKWSSGDIIAYTDGDCIVPPNWARSIAKNFKDSYAGFVGGPVEGFDKENFLSIYMDETFFQVKPGFRWRREATDLVLLEFPAGCNMAFRRHALEKIDFFDERINHGFDDLYPVERLGSRGFRIVLDPDVRVYHQHRTDLKELLKQHFKYGRGGALLVIHKRASKLARWFTTYLISTAFAVGLLIILAISAIWMRHLLPLNLSIGLFSLGFIFLMTLYLEPALRTRTLKKIIVYPILDIARGLAFTFGGLSQMFREIFGGRGKD
jgi:glycosyltransferase involved in cell wall biosynthesis